MLISYGQAIIVDSTISNNSAEYLGGGVENSLLALCRLQTPSSPIILQLRWAAASCLPGRAAGKSTRALSSGNMARLGGGMYNGNPTSINLVGVHFYGNVAGTTGDCFGAGIYNNQGYLNLSKVDFISNTFSISRRHLLWGWE